MKKVWKRRVTTVFAKQGHYAHDPSALKHYPPPDIALEKIGDLLDYDLRSLLGRK